jgi:hypothetical protein
MKATNQTGSSMKFSALLLTVFMLSLTACSTFSKDAPNDRVPASKEAFQLAPKAGGIELVKLLTKADPALKVKNDIVETGEINCVSRSSMGPEACIFYIDPSFPPRVLNDDAVTLQKWFVLWKKQYLPKANPGDIEIKNIKCDGQGNCEISMGGSGHGV